MKNNDLLSEGNKVEFERDLNQFIKRFESIHKETN